MNKHVILVLLSLLISPLWAQTTIKVLGMDYPPFVDSKALGGGISTELLQAALSPKYKVQLEVLPPARAGENFTRGLAPVSFLSVNYRANPEIKNINTQNVKMVFFYNKSKGDLTWSKLSDLAGKTIGMIRTLDKAGEGPLITAFKEAGIFIEISDSAETIFRKLDIGRVDLALAVELTGLEIIKTLLPNGSNIDIAKKPYAIYPSGPYFNTANPLGNQVMQDFQAGWKKITTDGTATRILEAYYGKGKVPSDALIY